MTGDPVEVEVARRLRRLGQHLTPGRRALVEVLRSAGRPLTVADIVEVVDRLHQSSIYRNLDVLRVAGVVCRMASPTGENRFELDETIVGHHHHLVCRRCGRVEDCVIPDAVEHSLDDAARAAGREHRFVIDEHRLDLVGLCDVCVTTVAPLTSVSETNSHSQLH